VKIYKIVKVALVSYGCETWSLRLREELRLTVSENRLLRRIFGLKGEGVAGGWRKLHPEELRNLYPSPTVISMGMKRAGHVARMGRRDMHTKF
jgi:hypothetical protein